MRSPEQAHPDHLDPLVQMPQTDHPDAIADARAEAARAIRDVGHALVGHHSPIELLTAAAAEIDAITARIVAGPSRSRAEERERSGTSPGAEWGQTVGDGDVMTSYEERPVSGRSSPWGLEPVVRRDGDEVVAEVTLRPGHEGAPLRSHGGIVAALFDDILGFVLTIHQTPGFTGELTIRYEAGTPIGELLHCRVRMDERQGRKLLMSGELSVAATNQVVARCRATFISIDPEIFHSMTTTS